VVLRVAAAGTSAAQPVREMAVERLIFDQSDQQDANQPELYTPRQLSSAPLRHMGYGGGAGGSYSAATSQHMGIYAALTGLADALKML
jgi:hypothetical protein